MQVNFYKYQGAGNDFIMIDNRNLLFPKDNISLINQLCNRRFGIGADGLILLEADELTDFKMVYFNADGQQSTLCGNGGRCIVAFANQLGIIKDSTSFVAIDGIHKATIKKDMVSLQMSDVNKVTAFTNHIFTDTGSPHHVQLVENLKDFPVFNEGRRIRTEQYGKAGSNINFVEQIAENKFKVRTYERGVEDETLACGTGVTAVALAMHKIKKTTSNHITLQAEGGLLEVIFKATEAGYSQIFLKGAATFVFKGTLDLA